MVDIIMEITADNDEIAASLEFITETIDEVQMSAADKKTAADLLNESKSLIRRTNENLGAVCDIIFEKTNQEC